MPRQGLVKLFGFDRYDTFEVLTVLSQRFRSSRLDSTCEELAFYSEKGLALLLRFTRRGQVVSVEIGDALADRELQTAAREIEQALSKTGRKVWRSILFSGRPLTGYWRYHDELQILPAPADAPRPDFLMADHPFVLEVTYDSSEDQQVGRIRRMAREREMGLLLALLLHGGVSGFGIPRPKHSWCLVPTSREAGPHESVFLQNGYFVGGFPAIVDEFTDTVGLEPVRLVNDEDYFTDVYVADDEKLEVPAVASRCFDQYFALELRERDAFLRSCYWFNIARPLVMSSHSAAYLALITALEVLAQRAPKARCDCCEACEVQKPGPTKSFGDFLSTYGPAGSKGVRSALYTLRSDISHGEQLLMFDAGLNGCGVLDPIETRQSQNLERAWRFGRIALLNWLGSQPGKQGLP